MHESSSLKFKPSDVAHKHVITTSQATQPTSCFKIRLKSAPYLTPDCWVFGYCFYSPGEYFVIVAISKDLVLNPRSCTGGILRAFRTTPTGDRLEFVHDTPVEDYPSALCAYQGRLLAGVGNRLRLYDMGKKKLLKKSENRVCLPPGLTTFLPLNGLLWKSAFFLLQHFPNLINGIYGIGQRIIVTDVQESLFWVRYKPRADIQLVIFADDASPRWVTQLAILDNSTAAVADKFGNVIVLRLPTDVNDNVEEDPSGTRSLWDRNALGGASQKLDVSLNSFIIADRI